MADLNPNRTDTPLPAPPDEKIEPFPVRGYVVLNLLFWAFCAVEIVIVRLWLNDIQGVIFFFLLLSVGFTLVSVYDALCDRFALKAQIKNDAPSD